MIDVVVVVVVIVTVNVLTPERFKPTTLIQRDLIFLLKRSVEYQIFTSGKRMLLWQFWNRDWRKILENEWYLAQEPNQVSKKQPISMAIWT